MGLRRTSCIFFGILLTSSIVGFSQPNQLPGKNIIFDQLPDNLGLGQSTINCIIQDREGFLWIGTWSGLVRYDGYSTIVYHSDNAPDKIKSNKITAIYEDHEGFIWVGTQVGGLFKYDKTANKFTQFIHQSDSAGSISNNSIWAIQEDSKKNLWIGTENGLNVYNKRENKFEAFYYNNSSAQSLSHSFITDLFLSSRGELWVGTENGLNRVRADDKRNYSFDRFIYNEGNGNIDRYPANHYLHNYIFQLGELTTNNSSSIWFSTIKGLKKLENGKISNFEIENKQASFSYFRSLKVVNGDHPFILVGSEMGLNFFDPNQSKFTKFLGDYDKAVNLTHNTVTTVFIDRGGVLWVGTKKGLNKYDTYSKDFELYLTNSFDKTNSIITGICQANDKGYWISTLGGGLFKFTGTTFVQSRFSQQIRNDFANFIQTLYKDSKGNLWVGTAGSGVFVFNENDLKSNSDVIKKFNYYEKDKQISDSHIMSFVEDAKGDMWIGMWSGGLNKIDRNGNVTQYADPILRQVPIVTLYADHSDVLWVGTRGNGLYRLVERNGKLDIRRYAHNERDRGSLINNFINAIYEDHAGSLWIGTEGGLVSFDRRTEIFELKISDEGPTNNVVSMLEDDAGKLWLAHWDGLSVFDPMNHSSVINYDNHDRIQGGFYYNNVCLKSQGLLIFGGSNGFNIIDPQGVIQNPVSPKIAIKDFQVFNKPVPYGVDFNGRVVLDKPLTQMDNIVLKYYENSVSFEFAALDYAAPDKIRYAYKLEGFDKNWNYTTSARRYANYTNLNQGNYTLTVKATNTEGVWSNQLSKVNFVISPPWWKTIWAAVAYFLLGITALYFFRRLVLMRVNFMHELKVERMQRDNLEKLNKAKLQFFTNVSHEFRTPLTLILGPAQSLLDAPEGGKVARDQILSINTNAQRLLRLVNQLLDFRKTESGNLKLEVAEGNIVKFVKEIKLSFEPLAEQMKINFVFIASSNVIKAWFDRDQFEKILFNLLSNAFKNTPEEGRITIQLKEEKDNFLISVEDNGRGIKAEHFENIFQSFFSYDEDHHHTGTGIGLALTKSLVEMHHGKVHVESQEHVFTRFIIQVPLGNRHFDNSELVHEINDVEDIEKYPRVTKEHVFDAGMLIDQPGIDNLEGLPKLLIVEDNAEVRAYIKSIFISNYRVLEAEEGKEAIDIAIEEIPDIVISDVMMPVMDGISFCKELKSNVKTSHIPVILLTARTSLIFKVEGLETGADDYVTKPFNPKVLELKVRNIIRSRELIRKVFKDNEILNIEPSHVTLNSADETFIKMALASIEQNMSDAGYSIEVLGKDVGMSRMQLYRKLKALTGQSANEFIRTIRLKRAAQLLEQKQLTIAEVTYEVGFNDLQYFRECFKKLFTVTPSEYVQRKAKSEVKDLE